jgi:hypothetical protein
MTGPAWARMGIFLLVSLCFVAAEDIGLSRAVEDGSQGAQIGGMNFDKLNMNLGLLDNLRSALANIIDKTLQLTPESSPVILNESEIAEMNEVDHSILVYANNTSVLVEDAKSNIISRRPAGSDDAAAIREAINIIDQGTVLCVGTFYINSPINNLKRSIRLSGMPGQTVFDCSKMKTDIFPCGCGGSGYAAMTTSLTEDALKGSLSIKVAETNDYKEGDYVKLVDNESIIGFKKGEILRIQNIRSKEIIFEDELQDGYTVKDAANIRRLNFTSDITVDGIRFIGPGIETNMCLFNLFLIKNFRFSNNEVVNFGRAAIYLSDSLDSTIENNLFENIYMTGLGYSVAVTNACNNILIRNNDFEVKGRHYITAGAGTGTRSSGGFVRNMKVVNNSFENCVQEAINSHPPFVGPIEIIRNRFESCGKGIEISNGDTAIVENNFTNCSIAIQLLGDEARVHNIYSNEFKDCRERILVETSNMTIYGDICNGQFLVKRDEIEFL